MKKKQVRNMEVKSQKARNKKQIRLDYLFFLIKFFLIFFFLTTIISIINLSFFQELLASLVGWFSGYPVAGEVIFVDGARFIVSSSCLGLVSVSILAAIIFALKQPKMKQKGVLFFTGFALLLIINVPRILLVLFLAAQGFDAELVHTLTWFLMTGVILLYWYFGMLFLKVDLSKIL